MTTAIKMNSRVIPRTGNSSHLITSFNVKAEIMTTPIFVRICTISREASSRSGSLCNLATSLDLLVFLAAIADWSDCDNEKYATSDPEEKAEAVSNIIINIIPAITDGVTG